MVESLDLSRKTVLGLLENIYSYNFNDNSLDLKLEKDVSDVWDVNSKKNNISFIGKLPCYTLYNLQKSKERVISVDEDMIFAIVGRAGDGKTSLSLLNGVYLDKEFKSNRVILNLKHLLDFLGDCAVEIKKESEDSFYRSYLRGSSVIIDEGVSLLFSADSNTKLGKLITKLFTVIRYLNLVMFINVTNYERLNKTIRESRLYGVIKFSTKGIIEYYSKKKTQQIKVTDTLDVEYPEPSFIEEVGFISKDNALWRESVSRKSSFVLDVINEVRSEVNKL